MRRDSNKVADALSNDAMDGNGWDGFKEAAVSTHTRLPTSGNNNTVVLTHQSQSTASCNLTGRPVLVLWSCMAALPVTGRRLYRKCCMCECAPNRYCMHQAGADQDIGGVPKLQPPHV